MASFSVDTFNYFSTFFPLLLVFSNIQFSFYFFVQMSHMHNKNFQFIYVIKKRVLVKYIINI